MSLKIWIFKEINNIMLHLPDYFKYYRLRDKLPFFTLLLYRADKAKHRKIYDLLAYYFILGAAVIMLLATYLWATNGSKSALTGFKWPYASPIQYGLQILIIFYLTKQATANTAYSTTLAYNAAAAAGWLYEIPFFIYSLNPDATIIKVNHRNIFLISYQIIACIIFPLLLHERGATYNQRDLRHFMLAYLATFFQAWRGSWDLLFGWVTTFARLPMILFSIHLALKLGRPPDEP